MFLLLILLASLSLSYPERSTYCKCDKAAITSACETFCQFERANELCGTRVRSVARRRKRKGLSRTRRIYNGRSTRINRSPWTVKLRPLGLGDLCSGSLISPHVVLTAAHCVYKDSNPRHWQITAGHASSSWFRSRGETGFQQRNVKQILFDVDDFDGLVLKDDLALLIVDEPFTITPHVRTICLPTNARQQTQRCMISGWGETEIGEQARTLQTAWLPLIPHQQCQAAYTLEVFAENICAGGEGQDTCRGDSGGPLACYTGGRFELAGVLSWGSSECGQIGKPAVYTSVVNYTKSILATVHHYK